MVTITASFVPRLAKKVRLRFDRHSGKQMLIYPERGLELNDSAAEIATRVDGTRSVMEIADDILRAKGIDAAERDAVVSDVIEFLEGLRKKGLLESAA
jgi:coenzyme PQQ biosynthesis protein PqqD